MSGRTLVTGGSGFVGRHVVAALRAAGRDVVSVGRGDADLLDPSASRRLIMNVRPDVLIHLAWRVEHGKFWRAPENGEWAEATGALARYFGEAGGRRFVGAGTCAEYDWTTGQASLAPGATPLKPATPYGAAKDSARAAVEAAAGAAGFSAAWGRLFHLYGPGEHPSRFVPSVASALVEGRRALTGDGARVRDFLHVADAGRAFTALAFSGASGSVNIGSGVPVTIEHVARTLARLCGRENLLGVGELPASADEPSRLVPDISALAGVGFAPRLTLEEGLAESLSWCRSRAAGAL